MNEYSADTTTSAVGPEMTGLHEGRLLVHSSEYVVELTSDHAGGNGHGAARDSRLAVLPRGEPPTGDTAAAVAWRPEQGWLPDGHGILRDTKVLIVDDSKLCREYLVGVICANGATRPSVAWDLASLITALNETMPRVILLSTTTRDSALLLERAINMNPSARVIVMGMSEDDESEIVACAEAGVAGYFLRNESLDDLLLLIRKVAGGESLCSPKVSAILLRRLSTLASQRERPTEELDLTAREAQILRMLEMGHSNKQIAQDLCIAVHTVKNHVHSLLTKLGVSTRAQAAALARTIWYQESVQES